MVVVQHGSTIAEVRRSDSESRVETKIAACSCLFLRSMATACVGLIVTVFGCAERCCGGSIDGFNTGQTRVDTHTQKKDATHKKESGTPAQCPTH